MPKRSAIALSLIFGSIGMVLMVQGRAASALMQPGFGAFVQIAAMGLFLAGCAGVLFLRDSLFESDWPVHLYYCSLVLALFAAGTGVLFLATRFSAVVPAGLDWLQYLVLWIFSGCCYAAAGFALGTALWFFAPAFDRILGFTFAAAAFGALAGVSCISPLGGPAAMILAALPAAAAGLILTLGEERPKELAILSGSLTGVVAALVIVHLFVPFLAKGNIRGYDARSQKWLPNNHLAFVDHPKQADSLSLVREGQPIDARLLGIQEGDEVSNLIHLPFLAGYPEPKTLVVGSGVLPYLDRILSASRQVTWLDPDGLTRAFPDTFANRKGWEKVEPFVENPLRRTKNPDDSKFDLAVWPIFQTWRPDAVGPVVLPGDPTWTRETLRGAMSAEIFAAFIPARPQSRLLRLVVMSMGILQNDIRAANPNGHLFIASDGMTALLLVKRLPFSTQEIIRLLDYCTEAGITMMFSPFKEGLSENLEALIRAPDFDEYVAVNYASLSLPDMKSPEFFAYDPQIKEPGTALSDRRMIRAGRWALFLSLLVTLVWAMTVFFVPLFGLRVHRLNLEDSLRTGGWFALFGLGFGALLYSNMGALRLSLLSPTFLYLVPPFVLLLGAGAGVALGQHAPIQSPTLRMRIVMIFLFALALFSEVVIFKLQGRFQNFEAALWIFILGLVAGYGLGFGLVRNHKVHRNSSPWHFTVWTAGLLLALALAPNLSYTFVQWAGPAVLFTALWVYRDL